MSIKAVTSGSGSFGNIVPGWSVSEYATPVTIGESAGGTGGGADGRGLRAQPGRARGRAGGRALRRTPGQGVHPQVRCHHDRAAWPERVPDRHRERGDHD